MKHNPIVDSFKTCAYFFQDLSNYSKINKPSISDQ